MIPSENDHSQKLKLQGFRSGHFSVTKPEFVPTKWNLRAFYQPGIRRTREREFESVLGRSASVSAITKCSNERYLDHNI